MKGTLQHFQTTPAYWSEVRQERILYLDETMGAFESAKSERNMQSDLSLSSL